MYSFKNLHIQNQNNIIIDKITEFSETNKIPCYIISEALIDKKFARQINEGFIVLMPKHKILVVNLSEDEEKFDDYLDDVFEDIVYLARKFDMLSLIGKKKKWEHLIVDANAEDINDFERFTEENLKAHKADYRIIDLIISLLIGSINDSKKITVIEPDNLLDKIKYKIQLFDADQTRFIYEDIDKKTVKIQGLAGTGKTELLLHKIKEIYISEPESKIALTCHNKILADSLRLRIPQFFDFMRVEKQIEWDKRLWCFNAWGSFNDPNTGLLTLICHSYGVPFFSYKEVKDFDTACKLTINNIKKKYKDEEIPHILDYIFVDESQDFQENFFQLVSLVTAKKAFFAGDIFQTIFDIPDNSVESDFLLSKCYRTDPKTLMFAQGLGLGLFEKKKLSWLSDQDWGKLGYNIEKDNNNQVMLTRDPIKRFEDLSIDFESIVIKVTNNVTKYILEQIDELKSSYPNIEPSDICVILLDKEDYIYQLDSNIGINIESHNNWDYNITHVSKEVKPNSVIITNRNNIKGLEFPFVFCITKKLTFDKTDRNALYTMLSRSFLKSYLIVYDSPDNGITDDIKEGLKTILNMKKMVVKIPTDEQLEEIKQNINVDNKSKSLNERVTNIMNELGIEPDDDNFKYVMSVINNNPKKIKSDKEIKRIINALFLEED